MLVYISLFFLQPCRGNCLGTAGLRRWPAQAVDVQNSSPPAGCSESFAGTSTNTGVTWGIMICKRYDDDDDDDDDGDGDGDDDDDDDEEEEEVEEEEE